MHKHNTCISISITHACTHNIAYAHTTSNKHAQSYLIHIWVSGSTLAKLLLAKLERGVLLFRFLLLLLWLEGNRLRLVKLHERRGKKEKKEKEHKKVMIERKSANVHAWLYLFLSFLLCFFVFVPGGKEKGKKKRDKKKSAQERVCVIAFYFVFWISFFFFFTYKQLWIDAHKTICVWVWMISVTYFLRPVGDFILSSSSRLLRRHNHSRSWLRGQLEELTHTRGVRALLHKVNSTLSSHTK